MRQDTRENLERLIARIENLLAALEADVGPQPDYFLSDRETYWSWSKKHRAGLDAIRARLEAEEKARFSATPGSSEALTMAGVRSSCTSGMEGLLRNWRNAARRRIAIAGAGEA
jgi:hypothetical protein